MERARPLPQPGSEELKRTVNSNECEAIYGFLYENQDDGVTMRQVIDFITKSFGRAHAHTDRRLRELYPNFEFVKTRQGRETVYRIVGWTAEGRRLDSAKISRRVRAMVLSPCRCAQCGRTPIGHGAVLVVDHKVPQAWGGGDDIENLQPLCTECNSGKQAWYSSHDSQTDAIKAAINHPEPQGRIGELLKACDGEWVPGDLIGIVASARNYQEDWQKRTRELRTLGWDIETKKAKIDGRFATYYRAASWKPWPGSGTIYDALKAEEKARKLSAQ